jgi:hypothetical protein
MGDADLVVFALPDPERATGYGDFLANQARFRVVGFPPNAVGVEPAEGAGAVCEYFRAHKLWDAASGAGGEGWTPLEQHPGFDSQAIDRARLGQYAAELLERNDLASHLYALHALITATPPADLPHMLERNVEAIFADLPAGSLWLVTTEERWVARLTVLRSRVALELTPDLPLNEESFAGLRALEGHSLTDTVDVTYALAPLLLALSPGVLGYAVSHAPHALVLMFGEPKELRVPPPRSLAALYEPNVLETYPPEPWGHVEVTEGLTAAEVEELLPWWLGRLNVAYSHATDPTRFVNAHGAHEPVRQYAWLLTFERMLADALLILSGPQSSALARQQAGFDLLDKAEALLDTGRGDSGRGFMRLLRRADALPKLQRSFSGLPGSFHQRFSDLAELLYDEIYQEIRAGVLPHRLTEHGVRVARNNAGEVEAEDMNTFVAKTLRAIRNSSHGFLDMLAVQPDRFRLATHTGDVPYHFANLAALIGLALVADGERLIDGSWWD